MQRTELNKVRESVFKVKNRLLKKTLSFFIVAGIVITASFTEAAVDSITLSKRGLHNDNFAYSGSDVNFYAGAYLRGVTTYGYEVLYYEPLTSLIGSGATIDSATFRFNIDTITTNGATADFYGELFEQNKGTYSASASYDTYALTAWTNSLGSDTVAYNASTGWYEITSTALKTLVQDWVDEAKTNEGLILAGNGNFWGYYWVISDAELVVDYTGGPLKKVFYSVGTSLSDLKAGSPTVDISSGTATFNISQPDTIGLGDEIDYDVDHKLAYISERISSTQYKVVTATGNTPADVTGKAVNYINRAFDMLDHAVNEAYLAPYLNTTDLVANGYQLNFVCYNDNYGVDNMTVTIDTWVTDSAHNIRIFTPVSPGEVGVSQRHNGTAGTGYRLQVNNNCIINNVDYVFIDGLEVKNTISSPTIIADDGSALDSVVISNMIIHGGNCAIRIFNTGSKIVMYNIIAYGTTSDAILGAGSSSSAKFYNSSIYGTNTFSGVNGVLCKNVISIYPSGSCFQNWVAGSEYNISSDATAPGTGSITAVAWSNQFVSTTGGSEDLHLKPSSDAIDVGINLSSMFTTDIHGSTRFDPWDVGADEFIEPAALKTWTGSVNNSWENTGNWSPASAPTSTDSVVFNNTGINHCNLSTNPTVSSITFTSGYTGSFNLNGLNLSIERDADFSSGGPIMGSGGGIYFISSNSHKLVPPSSGGLPGIIQNGSGTTTVEVRDLTCDSLSVNSGVFDVQTYDLIVNNNLKVDTTGTFNGSNGNIDVGGSVEIKSASATLNAPSDTLFVMGDWYNDQGGTFNASPDGFVVFNSPMTGNSIYSGSDSFNHVVFAGAVGEWTLYDDLYADTLNIYAGKLYCGTGRKHNIGNLVTLPPGGSGVLDFSNCTLNVSYDADFSMLDTVTATNGKLKFVGATTQYFSPHSMNYLPWIVQDGSGTTMVSGANPLNVDSLDILDGEFDMNGKGLWAYYGLEVANSATFTGSSGKVNVSGELDISSSSATFNAPSDTLFIGGHFNNSMNGTFNTGGPIVFNGGGSGYSIYPGSATYNNMVFDGSGSEWYLNNSLSADTVHIREGKLICGSDQTHYIGNLFSSNNTGVLDFSNCTLSINYDADFQQLDTITATNGKLKFVGAGTQYFYPHNMDYPSWIVQDGSGTTMVSGANPLNVDSLDILDGEFDMNGNGLWAYYGMEVANSATFTGSTGKVNVSGDLYISSSSATFNAPSDTLFVGGSFDNAMNGTFNTGGPIVFNGGGSGVPIYPGSPTYNNMVFDGSGSEWYLTDILNADTVHIRDGKLNCGSNQTHTIGNLLSSNNTGVLDFSSCTLNVSYNADFSMLDTITASGRLKFDGTGTQVLTPKASDTLPAIDHIGSGTLQLATNNLVCGDFYQDTGTLNFNSKNIQTVAGDFTVINGTSSTFQNLDGDTITVSGNAGFSGQSDSLLNMNPAGTWWLNVAGTLNADYANIGNSDASLGSQGTPTANCINSGGNTNWAFNTAPQITGLSAASNISASQTAGSLNILVDYEVSDADQAFVTITLEYFNSSVWSVATTTSGSVGGGIDATSSVTDHQITWDVGTDLVGIEVTNYNVRVIADDGQGSYNLDTLALLIDTLKIDTKSPLSLAGLSVDTYTATTADLSWTAATDLNFDHYEIWFGNSQTDVQNRTVGPGADEWDNVDDANLATMATTTTTVTGLSVSTTYYFKIWAIDSYGNEMTIADVSQAINTAPVVTGLSAASNISANQTTDGSLNILVDYEVSDAEQATVTVTLEYWNGGWLSAATTSGDVGAGIDATASATDRQITWDVGTDLPGIEVTNYNVRVIANDGEGSYNADTTNIILDTLTIDTKSPMTLSSLNVDTYTTTTVDLSWTAAADGNFDHYEIWFGTSQTDVQNRTAGPGADEWDGLDDANLASLGTTTTTISGLTSGQAYWFKIWAIDSYGNELTIAEVSQSLNLAPTDITMSISNVNENEPVGTVVGTFSTTDPNTGDTHSYTLVAGTGDADNASFIVDADSLKTAEIFDFETKSSYSIRVRTTDNGTGNLTYEEAFTITVNDMNEPPVISGSGGSITYTENDTATVIDNGITVSDLDNANFNSAEVSISTNFAASEDTLEFVNQGGITGSYNSGTGVLSLAGSDIVATYQAALRSVKYKNSSQTPSAATRTVSFSVNDGTNNSNTVTRDISIAVVNDAPVISGTGGSITYTENDTPTVVDNGILVTDADNTNFDSAEVNISVNYVSAEDSLLFTDQNGIAGSFNSGTGALSLSGPATLADYETALRSVKYENLSDNPSAVSRTVSFVVNDGVVNSNTVTRDINVTPINDAPVANDTGFTINQHDTLNVSAPGVMENDIDAEADPLTATLVADVNGGALTLSTDGSFEYIPDSSFAGIDSFVYQAFDGSLNSNAATVTITVNDITPPVVVSLAPADNTAGVGADDSLVITFDEIIYKDNGNISIAHSSDSTLFETIPVSSGNVTGDGTSTITIDPANSFIAETGYFVMIDATCFMDAEGNYFLGYASDTEWNFITFVDTVPPLPVTGLTASALNCSTMTVNWTPSTSPDANEVKVCASSIAMPMTQDSGEYSQTVGSAVTSAAFTGLPKYGATMYVAAFVVDNSGNWSAFSAGASNTVKLPDGVPPDNTIEAAFANIGDSAVTVFLDLPDSIEYTEAGIYFSLSHNLLHVRSSYPDTTISLTLGFHDTTFTLFNIVKQGWWHSTWAPFDSADNIGPEKSDSIMINNTPPVVTILYQYTLSEDSAWAIDSCAYDINDDPINLTLINAPLGMFISQTTLSVSWTPGDEDVGLHTVGLVADDGTAQSDTILMALTVLNTNDSPILMSAFFPDTAFEDSLVEGEIAVYDPDNDDSLNISFNIRISWLTATVTPPTTTDSLWRFKLKGTPGNNDTGTVQFIAIIKDVEDVSVSSDHALYVVNTNDAPVTQLIKKQVMFGAARYVMAGVDDFDSLLTFYATFDEIDTAEAITRSANAIINNDGVFTFYPLADGRYFFTCYSQDQAGVGDLTPFEDTLIIANVMSRTWSDSGVWNMVSVPVPSYSAEPFKASGKILHWDESKEPNDIYKYYIRSGQISELSAGYSYWIKLDSAVSVTLDKDSLSTDTVTIPLHKAAYGWNQIASPYIYPVRWEKDLTLWKWNTVVHDFEEAEGVLYPWEGYWALTDSEDSAAISPEPYFISKSLTRRSRTCFVDNKEWTFGIELTSNINRDADNLFGVSRHAKNGYDKLDRPEPPRAGSEPYLFFAHPEWKRSIDEFASDIRRTWDDKENVFQIGISPCAQDVTALTLNITGYSEDMKIYLFVNTSSGVVKYNEGMALSVEPSDKVQYRTVFATSNKDFLNNFPRKFVLNHPYPNPCRPSATIRYTLPYNWGDSGWLDTKPYKVKMVIYDARGRVVREIVDRKQKPGQYKVVWRGKTDTGRRIASGFYFCRLVAGKHSSVRKIIAIR